MKLESRSSAPASGCELTAEPGCELTPAAEYTVDALTAAYNQTRVDYIVPMPMNVSRLQAYIDHYDVDLGSSVVAHAGDEILGLAMLGVRPGHSWITRLGVLPVRRRNGAGESMMNYLIGQSRALDMDYVILEVIKNNVAAHRLFLKLGFEETRELLILRRPPGPPLAEPPGYRVMHGDEDQALNLLERRRSVPSWLDELSSLKHVDGLSCLEIELDDGGGGWCVYQRTAFQLGRLVLQTEQGDPGLVAQALMHALHTRYPAHDTKTENLPADDRHLSGLMAMHYIESFRRIEMRLDLRQA